VKRQRLAAIDIGSNSIRCIVVETNEQGKYRILDDEKSAVRLGEGLARDGAISQSAWQRALQALTQMKKIVDSYGVIGIETVATSAVRAASNGDAFAREVAERVGLELSVISGEEEAELAMTSALNNFDMEGNHFALMDIGGGSVELVTAFGSHVEQIASLRLGAVVLTENFVTSDPLRPKEYLRLRKHIGNSVGELFAKGKVPIHCLLGSGGTVTTMAAMVMALRGESFGSVHGYELLRSEVVHLLAMLRGKSLKGRRAIPGLNPDRADIIVAGVAVVDELMEQLGANVLKINERGIREGVILKSLKKHGLLPLDKPPRSWRAGVLEFARSCHHEEQHSLQVEKLSRQLFAALAGDFGLEQRDLRLLQAAALLHDVGYFIGYSGHHKHSYHLIRHADLFDFTPREREVIAQIARYHRKSLPKKKHDDFMRLSEADQLLVWRLAGILRLADGLDRRRSNFVSDLECALTSSSFKVRLKGSGDLSVEHFSGSKKGDLFETAFDRKLQLGA
jgi:exopolyphosphatase / guanosine-5'-triphosphate,3'-diphosphate pyrophosphatase